MKPIKAPPSKPRFWDNVIPLRADHSGHQLAGWQPSEKAMEGLGCQILADQRVPVAPGIELAAGFDFLNEQPADKKAAQDEKKVDAGPSDEMGPMGDGGPYADFAVFFEYDGMPEENE